MKKAVMMLSGVVFMVLALAVCLPASALEAVEHSWGTVLMVSGNQIVLEEYDSEADDYVPVIYTIRDHTIELQNVASLSDVAAGDEAEVGFVAEGLEKIAVSLYIEKDSSLEEE